jgi:hypothetical protein
MPKLLELRRGVRRQCDAQLSSKPLTQRPDFHAVSPVSMFPAMTALVTSRNEFFN